MLEILKSPEVIEKLNSLQLEFAEIKSDENLVDRIHEQIKEIDEWQYSTGPIFEYPPYMSEMSGSDPGRLLKKSYPSPQAARIKGNYSSGFEAKDHIITIFPAKLSSMPLRGLFYKKESQLTRRYTFEIFEGSARPNGRPSSFTGLGHIFFLQEGILAHVGVGARNAWAIWLYYYGENNQIAGASMVTAPFNIQSDYEMHYDDDGLLESITSGTPVWERKVKK
jgi:hypothetical protein